MCDLPVFRMSGMWERGNEPTATRKSGNGYSISAQANPAPSELYCGAGWLVHEELLGPQ